MSALLHMCERERLLVARTYDTQHHAARRTLVYARAAAAAPRARARVIDYYARARGGISRPQSLLLSICAFLFLRFGFSTLLIFTFIG
jgi:hypothetical protein